jgi:hypothetical protein
MSMALSRRAKRFFTTEDTPYLVIVSRVEMNTMIKINTCIKRNAKFHLSLSYIYIYISNELLFLLLRLLLFSFLRRRLLLVHFFLQLLVELVRGRLKTLHRFPQRFPELGKFTRPEQQRRDAADDDDFRKTETKQSVAND